MREQIRELIETTILTLSIFAVLQFSIQNYLVQGPSMVPTLNEGERLFVNKLIYKRFPSLELSKNSPFITRSEDKYIYLFNPPKKELDYSFVRTMEALNELTLEGKIRFVSWRIKPIDNHSCSLSISVYMYKLDFIPKVLRWIPHMLYVRPLLKNYLLSVTGGFEYYLQTGKSVSHNQFGNHPWFSIKK